MWWIIYSKSCNSKVRISVQANGSDPKFRIFRRRWTIESRKISVARRIRANQRRRNENKATSIKLRNTEFVRNTCTQLCGWQPTRLEEDSIGLDSEIRWFQRNEKDVVIYDRNTENATPSLSSFHALWERKRFYRHPLCSRNTVAPGASITSFLPTQPSLAVFPPFCSFPPLSLSLSNLQSPVDQKKRSRRRRRKRRGLESPRSIVIQRLLIINLQRGRRKRKRDSRCLLSSIERMWFIIRSNNDSYEGINY